MSLLEKLKEIHKKMQNPDNWNNNGICEQCPVTFSDKELLYELFANWPKFSGSLTFPIGNGRDIYMETYSANQFWNREISGYAALRWELLEWMIEQLEKEQDERRP